VQLAGRPVESDPSAGEWVARAVAGRQPGTVGSLVPPVFEAYARVLHPAYRYADDDDVEVGWAEVAAFNGTTAHALMQWPSITGSWDYVRDDDQPEVWNGAPDEGHLPAALAARMAAVLAGHTTTPDDCWFGIWHGFEFLSGGSPTLSVPGREYWLLRGPVELAAANLAAEPSEQSANLWWPADRAWCVATDIDLMSTYVGGSQAAIAALLAVPGVDAWPASPQHPVGFDADRINPSPQRL
jgi:hypothetical protein